MYYRLYHVTPGPQHGQLILGGRGVNNILILDIASDSVIHRMSMPSNAGVVDPVAVSATGEILVTYSGGKCGGVVYRYGWCRTVALYSSVSEATPAIVYRHKVRHLRVAYPRMINNANEFLVPLPHQSDILVVGTNGTILHTIDVLNGQDGVWLNNVHDLAVWENCLWVASYDGDLVLLCPG